MEKTTLDIEIYEKAPADFVDKVQVSACYLEVEGRLLLLQRAFNKQEPGKWGVPAGKLEEGETAKEAAVRELFEETGIQCLNIQGLGALYMRKHTVDYVYHLFKMEIAEMLSVILSNEHEGYIWASKEDLEVLPLMVGAEKALQFYEEALSRGGF